MSEGPMTEQQLMVRWHIEGPNSQARKMSLRRRCARWGLKPLEGSRPLLFRVADVERAEARAAGVTVRGGAL